MGDTVVVVATLGASLGTVGQRGISKHPVVCNEGINAAPVECIGQTMAAMAGEWTL